jgi:nicotinamidase-related amidase
MKERYFTKSNIDEIAGELAVEVSEKTGRKRDFPRWDSKYALLVLDMQDYFLRENSNAFVPSAPAVIPKVNSLIELFEEKKLPVFFTRHVNTTDNAAMMGQWWSRLIEADGELSEISGLLNIPAGSEIIKKTQYDAFHNTALDDTLKAENINTLVISGVMTNLCVETTIRSAFVHGYETVLPLDATAAYNYDFHRATALNLAFGFSHIALTADIIREIGEND